MNYFFLGEIEAIDIGRLTVQGENEGRVIGAKRSVKTNVVNPVVQSGYILDPVRPPYRTVDDLTKVVQHEIAINSHSLWPIGHFGSSVIKLKSRAG